MKLRSMIAPAIALLAVCGMIYITQTQFTYPREVPIAEAKLRDSLVETAESWRGIKESDQSHRPVVDIYNSHKPLARDYEVQYDDEWCSTFVSAVAVQCELTGIIPTECGCEPHVQRFMDINAWEENDDYIPLPGDIIFYSVDDGNEGDNVGWAEHVGIVVGVWRNTIKVMEGNKDDAAAYRLIRVGDWRIRGYGTPDYASLT